MLFKVFIFITLCLSAVAGTMGKHSTGPRCIPGKFDPLLQRKELMHCKHRRSKCLLFPNDNDSNLYSPYCVYTDEKKNESLKSCEHSKNTSDCGKGYCESIGLHYVDKSTSDRRPKFACEKMPNPNPIK